MFVPKNSRTDLRLVLCLSLLASLPFANAPGNGFTFDDHLFVESNPAVSAKGFPYRAFLEAFEPGHLYRPLTVLSYWIQRRWLPGAAAFHSVNVALHVVVSCLVFLLARRRLSRPAAFAAAALFAVHPVHTEAVTSVVGRAESLAAGGVLATLLCVGRSLESPNPRFWSLAASFFFACALLSKEHAFVALLLAPAFFLPARKPAEWRRLVATLLPSVAVGCLYLAWRWALLGSLGLPEPPDFLDNPAAYSPPAWRIATAAVVLSDYVRLFLWPLRLSADYSFPQVPPVRALSDPRLLAAVLLFASSGLLALATRNRLPEIGRGVALAGLSFALTANVFFPIGTIEAERLLYLPSVFLCLALGSAVAAAAHGHPRPTAALFCAACALLACRTWMRNADWKSDLTLFRATVATSPRSAKAHHNLAVVYADLGDPVRATAHFERAWRLHPSYAEAAFGVGRMYEIRGFLSTALGWYERAARIDPSLWKAHLNRGVLHYNRGAYREAEAAFREGLALVPRDARLLTGLGLSRLALGDREGAIRLLELAVRSDPVLPEARQGLELALEARSQDSRRRVGS
ncbi:MAG: hypothetical protein KatS3mg076_1143 [Candidatus Binatia bacterium]|nr:MAG: hypothetical protein KatS3mg076_1143 [Candidatus Binatia bacterium]